VISRTLAPAKLVVGFALAIGCGRTEMGVLARAADSGASAGWAGSESGGTGGTGGSGGVSSGTCAEATCLTPLFQACVPEGSCSVQDGGSPSASFNTGCYANGVTVSYLGSYSGTNLTDSLTVRRNGVLCYSIDTSTPMDSNAATYVVRGASGEEVATGALVDKTGTVSVTCKGSQPTPVGATCLKPVADNSGCEPGTCP
jgi:hypothetical protein